MSSVVWHDIECGSYVEDLALWQMLASEEEGPILDVGAGTGRVTLDLARAGHEVVALDRDMDFLEALLERAGDLPVRIECADARGFDLGERFGLVLAPMQTVQLLGPDGRAGFLRSARACLADGGLVACALANAMEAFDADHTEPPLPDQARIGDTLYSSQPIALRDEGSRVAIERVRTTLRADGSRSAEGDVIRLDRVDGDQLAMEARAHGLRPLTPLHIPQTTEHVGSEVVLLRG